MLNQALGAFIDLDVVPLIGDPYHLSGKSHEMLMRSASFAVAETTGGILVQDPALGDVLATGSITLSLSADDARTALASHSGVGIDDVALDLVGLITLVTASAQRLESTAAVNGSCACGDQETHLRADGSTTAIDTTIECFIGSALQLPEHPEPNTELLDALGVRVVINEQILDVDPAGGLQLRVNALHIYLTDVLVSGLGSVSGEVLLGQSIAGISCGERASVVACTGDCNGDAVVTVDELVLAVSLALGLQPMHMCNGIDMDDSGSVTVDEILAAVDHILLGCSAR